MTFGECFYNGKRGGLGQRMPGIHQLAPVLGANHKTVAAAIGLLKKTAVTA
jgi:hypothetical protein